RQNTGFDDWRFVLHRKYFDASLRASAHTGVAIRSPKKLATQGVLTYFLGSNHSSIHIHFGFELLVLTALLTSASLSKKSF
ncbi:MAG: hypothetical protein IKW10_02840, partial [Oscillospiraceae bacterium]|nr:hypothetical protein [Oscillospiraceae bacterium]